LPVKGVARHIEKYCVDPDLPVPDSLKARFGSLTEDINTHELWIVLGTTSADHKFKTYEPALAAYAPDAFAKLIRSTARQITERRDMARRQLSLSLIKHFLVFEKDEKEAVYSAWNDLMSGADGWGETERVTEIFLFKLVLANLDGDAQLAALLRRPEVASDWVSYKDEFLPIRDWHGVHTLITNPTNAKTLSRIMWFLSAHSSAIPHDLLNNSVVPLLDHEDGIVRSTVLELIYETKDADSINAVIQSGWTWNPSNVGFQNHWGSLILGEYGESLAFNELCRRVPSNYLGYAIMHRGNKPDEVHDYAELIHQLWLRLDSNSPDLPVDLPNFTVEASASGEPRRVSQLDLAEDSSTRSVRFNGLYSTWGGMVESSEHMLSDWDAIEEHRHQLWKIINEAIEKPQAAGNIWFGDSFHSEALDKVVEKRPDLVTEWVLSDLSSGTIHRGSSFYTTLCSVLFEKQVDKGIELYSRLQESRTRIIDHDTQIDLLDYALFDTAPSEELVNAWSSKLEECNTDQELMKVTLLAQHGKGGDWLLSYVNERIHSRIPIDKARAIVLLGFLDGQRPLELTQQLRQSQFDTWPEELTKIAEQRRARNDWAKHWFNCFLTVSDDVIAWASFRLLLRCIDTRFWFWREQLENEVGAANINIRRKVFMSCNSDSIRNAIRANEKEMAEQLFGQKILQRQVWPWM
jgi:hypothetical protein